MTVSLRKCNEPDLLPQLVWHVCPLDCLNIQVNAPIFLLYGGVTAVCKRTGAAVAKAGDVVFIAAEVLSLCLDFVRAVAVIDYLWHRLSVREPFGCTSKSKELVHLPLVNRSLWSVA